MLFARVANETADWVLRDMRSHEGGFYSSLDAGSEGHEGKFYVWTPGEIQGLLSKQEYAAFSARFGLDRTSARLTVESSGFNGLTFFGQAEALHEGPFAFTGSAATHVMLTAWSTV